MQYGGLLREMFNIFKGLIYSQEIVYNSKDNSRFISNTENKAKASFIELMSVKLVHKISVKVS